MGRDDRMRDKPPRPRNAWMLFLCAYHDERKAMQQPPLIDPETAKHTKIVSERWKNLPFSEKEKWHAKAEQEKEEHAARFPGYKYQPSKHKQQRTFDGGPKAQRKMQQLAQFAQAKIQQDVGGRLIWVDVAENGKSVAEHAELYDAPLACAPLRSHAVDVGPYDHTPAPTTPCDPVYLSPVAQYTTSPCVRIDSFKPESEDEDVGYGTLPSGSDWEDEDEDYAELFTPCDVDYPRRGLPTDSLRIVMTVQNKHGALIEVDAGVLPTDPERPLSPPISVMQLVRESQQAKSAYGSSMRNSEKRCYVLDNGSPIDQSVVPAEYGRALSTSSSLCSSSPEPPAPAMAGRQVIRQPQPRYSLSPARLRSSDRHTYAHGPPLASPVRTPLSAQPFVMSSYSSYSHFVPQKEHLSSARHSLRSQAPYLAHPYRRPQGEKFYTFTSRSPAEPAWLSSPPSNASPPRQQTSRLPLPRRHTLARLQGSEEGAFASHLEERFVRVKEEELEEDIEMEGAIDTEGVAVKLEGEERLPPLMFRLAPIHPPPSPVGRIRLPPIQVPRSLSPRPSSSTYHGQAAQRYQSEYSSINANYHRINHEHQERHKDAVRSSDYPLHSRDSTYRTQWSFGRPEHDPYERRSLTVSSDEHSSPSATPIPNFAEARSESPRFVLRPATF